MDEEWPEDVLVYEDHEFDLEMPNPLWVTNSELPEGARGHILNTDNGYVIIDDPAADDRGLGALEPVFDVVRSLLVAHHRIDDFTLLPGMGNLVSLNVTGRMRIPPPAARWENLQSYSGPWQKGVEHFIRAPHFDALSLRGVTQDALDLVHRPLDVLGLSNVKIAPGSPWISQPAKLVAVDLTRSMDVGRFHQLPHAEHVVFDCVGEVRGMDEVSRQTPFQNLSLRNVRSLGATNMWDIRAREITVDGTRKQLPWLIEGWKHRPHDWAETWVHLPSWLLR